MNCPTCNRHLASTLSVCWSCGTMMNDSVREELAGKVLPRSGELIRPRHVAENAPAQAPIKAAAPIRLSPSPRPVINTAQTPVKHEAILPPAPVKTQTGPIEAKPTSPTLVEFQNKNAALPDWRLQLQNAVRQRHTRPVEDAAHAGPSIPRASAATQGATALKIQSEVIERAEPAAAGNPKLAEALKRIEASRERYLEEETPKAAAPIAGKSYPFAIAPKQADSLSRRTIETTVITKPKLVPAVADVIPEKYDTSKLPPLPAKISSSFEGRSTMPAALESAEVPEVEMYMESGRETDETEELEYEEDFAPVSLRFNAGLFDLIIGSFLSAVLLAPFVLTGGNWFSVPGLLAFLVTNAIVMFLYLTATIGTMGRTLGMRFFSLELIDVDANDYPSFHQAAVNSVVYLISLALGGIGFLPLLFNSEKRAAHDLLSNTIVVREY
jgi:uncharacterized RDD family membrane protein YckC